MRGTLRRTSRLCCGARLIPAHAGNTLALSAPQTRARAHPRACGEHSTTRRPKAASRGSSPRMRGTLIVFAGAGWRKGLIPAHAGNTSRRPLRTSTDRAHPRACGEHSTIRRLRHADKGSSPRMRGTQVAGGTRYAAPGLIPAHAGNTPPLTGTRVTPGAHPRACGEHVCDAPSDPAQRGSSPRMRGTRRTWRRTAAPSGLIPAHAGNTLDRDAKR